MRLPTDPRDRFTLMRLLEAAEARADAAEKTITHLEAAIDSRHEWYHTELARLQARAEAAERSRKAHMIGEAWYHDALTMIRTMKPREDIEAICDRALNESDPALAALSPAEGK